MKNKVLLSRLCICTLAVSLLAGCSSAGSTSETTNNSETESISSETASETVSENESATTASFASLEKTDLFEQQNSIDEALQQEASAGYSFEEPNVIVNPYGNSPLTAVAAFHTDKELGGTVTVKGKDEKDDITGTFEAATDHLVPIYGLYNGDTTEVVLTLEDGTSTTVEVTTEKTEVNVGTIETTMSDDSAYDYSNLTFVCSSAGMLYALDSAGDIRWYFTDGGILGVHQLKNGHLMMPTSFLLKSMYYKAGLQEIDLSGKIYHQYMIPGGMHHDFQELPDGNFPTCPYPNPEIFEALRLGLELAEKSGADLMLATDPDADRVGIAVKCKDGSYELLSGNEVGVLLLDYICAGRIEQGTMPKDPVMCKSIVSTPLADKVAEHYGVECRNVLTGFKWIGDQIAKLEAAGQVDRFIFGFEESYGYLAGPYVRDKDAIIGSMLICEMAAYYRAKGSSIKEELERIYAEYGRYLNKVDSFEFPGLSGMDKMASIMSGLRENPPKDFGGDAVVKVVDYKKPEETGLPAANVLIYTLASGCTVVVRPSGTEPKIKTYFTTKGKDLAEAEAKKEELAAAVKPLLA